MDDEFALCWNNFQVCFTFYSLKINTMHHIQYDSISFPLFIIYCWRLPLFSSCSDHFFFFIWCVGYEQIVGRTYTHVCGAVARMKYF